MINKNEISKKIEMAKELADKYELASLSNDFEMLKKSNEEYKINVLFIGGYSAGKSALLNCMIGSEKLVENQAPETAIATELSFAEVDSIVAISNEGKSTSVESLQNIEADTCNHVVYNVYSENLRELPEYVLVDTPGFDSGIERHNKALMQYIGKKGTAYVLVVDCEKGTLSHSALNYLNEVSHYSNDIAVIINKCDKKTEDDVMEIKEHISKLLVSNCGKECPIITTSKYDEDVVTKILSLIQKFEPQELYEKNVGTIVDMKISDLTKALTVLENNKSLDVSDIEEEIEKREKTKEKLQSEVRQQQANMKQKMHNDVKNKIINNISAKLNNNAKVLADAYKISVESFQEKVISMIRPIIIKSVENYESVAYEDIIKGINISNLNLGADGEEIGAFLSEVLVKMENMSSVLSQTVIDAENTDKNVTGRSSYRVISSFLAIATDVIAPPLELLIVILPDLINFVHTFIGNNQDQRLIEEIQRKVIPQIVDKISEEIEGSLDTVEEIMAQNIEETISELIQVEADALEKAIEKKNELENNYEQYIEQLKVDISLLA
mgnify:FL=1